MNKLFSFLARFGGSTTKIEFDWITIPAGEFLMGSDPTKDAEAARNDMTHEFPQHRVSLRQYSIARFPVTNAQYKEFVDATGHRVPEHWVGDQIPEGKETHPVVCVNWDDARTFCRWANVRLPSEAEWEKAARGTDGRIYPWGNDKPTQNHCNFSPEYSALRTTTPVDKHPLGKSPYGVMDMAGNVEEWTNTLHKGFSEMGDDYPYDANDGRENPESMGRSRVARGGGFTMNHIGMRCAQRSFTGGSTTVLEDTMGFRVAKL